MPSTNLHLSILQQSTLFRRCLYSVPWSGQVAVCWSQLPRFRGLSAGFTDIRGHAGSDQPRQLRGGAKDADRAGGSTDEDAAADPRVVGEEAIQLRQCLAVEHLDEWATAGANPGDDVQFAIRIPVRDRDRDSTQEALAIREEA